MPPSRTRAMLGWSIMASACRSASNRDRTCRLSMPGLISLRATRRRTGSVCSATQTVPHAAFADLLQQLVAGGDEGAGAIVGAGWRGRGGHVGGFGLQETAGLLAAGQQGRQALSQRLIARAGVVQKFVSIWSRTIERGPEELKFVHGSAPKLRRHQVRVARTNRVRSGVLPT